MKTQFKKYQRNDFVTYVGGSISKYLTYGKKYRLTCSPFRNKVAIINDKGLRQNTLKIYFKPWNYKIPIDNFNKLNNLNNSEKEKLEFLKYQNKLLVKNNDLMEKEIKKLREINKNYNEFILNNI